MRPSRQNGQQRNDDGFMLAAVVVLVFFVLLTLTIAAPRVAMHLKRDREVEAAHRANQYVRAVRVYYRKFQRYPTTVEQLENSNNQKFLRQKYLDPLTGKDDWRLIHVGENKTKVKGFFGEDLPGLGGAGLGGTSGGGISTTGSTQGSSGNSPFGGAGGGNTNAGSGSGNPGSGGFGAGNSGSTSGTGGVGSQSATGFNGNGGGPIMGIGSSKSGEAIVTVNEQTNYQDWEFLYDPRIEELYKKGNLLGGISSASGIGGSGGAGGTGSLTPSDPNNPNNPTKPNTPLTPAQPGQFGTPRNQ